MPCFRTWSAYCFVSDHGKGEPKERRPMSDTQAAKNTKEETVKITWN